MSIIEQLPQIKTWKKLKLCWQSNKKNETSSRNFMLRLLVGSTSATPPTRSL
ncbi:MAG: hypothetical protein MGF17_14615 [Trichodesmium sp. MAG_R04]|nr:hypothetical protein [Trichodesmium sp. MAG_R04]